MKQLIFVLVLSKLNFACKMFGSFGMASFNGDVRVNESGTWNNFWIGSGNQVTAWINEIVFLDSFAGSNVEFDPLPTHCQLNKIGNFKLLIRQLLQPMQFPLYFLVDFDLLEKQI